MRNVLGKDSEVTVAKGKTEKLEFKAYKML